MRDVTVFKCKYWNMLKEKVETKWVLGHTFECAYGNIQNWLDETLVEGCWDIISLKPEKMYIVNAYLDSEEDNDGQVSEEHFQKLICPNCGQKNLAPTGMQVTKCLKCKKEFTTAENQEEETK